MAKVKVKMNHAEARRIMNAPDMQVLLASLAGPIAASANASVPDGAEGYKHYVRPGKNRARAVVHTSDWATRRHNSKTNALLKALG